MLHVSMPWRRTVVELVDSEDESWLNQPKFMLSESDSDSDDFDSGIGVAYVEAVAAMKKVTLSKCKANLSPRQSILSSQAGNSESPVPALDWLHTTPADGTPTGTNAPVSLLHPVQNKSQPTLPHPPASQQSTAEAAQPTPEGAQSTARMEASSNAVSNIAVSEAGPLQQPSTLAVVAEPAVSTHDMPQLLEQPQLATASSDQPQPTISRVQHPQPASKLAANKEEERPSAIADGIQPQAAAPNMDSPSAVLAKVHEPQLATAEGSQPPAAATAPEMDSPSAATISEAVRSQLITAIEAQPQPTVPQFLDLLFPPEQLQALPRNPPSSSPTDSLAVPEPLVLHVHTGADHAVVADLSAVTTRSSSLLPGTTDILTDASTAAPNLPTVEPVAERSSTLDATTAAAFPATAPGTANAGSIDCAAAAGTTPTAPAAAASHLSGPSLIAVQSNCAVQDAAAAAMTTTDGLPGASSACEAGQTAQPTSSTLEALGTADTGLRVCQPAEAAAVPSVAVSMLTQLAQQIAKALADAAIQLVPQQHQQQKQQLQPLSTNPQQQQQQQQKQQQPTQQLQQHRLQQLHQQKQQQQQQQQQILAAASSRELVAALSADASGAALAACLAMTKPAVPVSVSPPGLLPVPAVSMATDTPEAAGLPLPALSSASASAASAPAAAAAPTMLPSYSFPQKPRELHSGNSTQPEAVAWPSSGMWPGNLTYKPQLLHGAVPPVRLGPPPPGRLGPPAPPVLTAPVPRPPPAAWPQLPVWPPQWPPLPWGQPLPAPVGQYLRPVIAPPAPPPGSPPPQPVSGSAALPLPSPLLFSREVVTSASAAAAPAPAMPLSSLAQKLKEVCDGKGTGSEAVAWPSSGTKSRAHKSSQLHRAVLSNVRLPLKPQKRKGLAQPQKQAAKRRKAPVESSRGPHQRADSAGSVGSVYSNAHSSKEEVDHPGAPSKKSPAVAHRSSGGGQAASTAARPGKRFRQKLQRKSKLAECAQQAYAVASGKVLPDLHAVPYRQRDRGQLPKGQGKKGKGKGQGHRSAQSQRGRKGLSWNPQQSKP